jgi:hypothetical protein
MGAKRMSAENTSLPSDFEMYERNRKDWVQNHGDEFVVISGGKVAGFYKDYETALRAGLREFGVQSQFLVKQVCAQEPVFVIY